ncbi:hypothetical protein ASPSYDRAFT_46073 [Aspergillus sydowii CBS 593.65]|uniref:Uncharacterized protein n=1 Tax=Aspergillus sydowii CBS 593.65 TaxID=1036612 RepID=A0A1L9TFD1_9EURO|nr:uncharacterized protein ASPSYDRAFT_46073 [Aspergillus sydowii CBS 593.65]OJJ58081.1 hypothetical protein ASPSYDRAFT_46073 [Aspergillus sydowii CBS 593.65]
MQFTLKFLTVTLLAVFFAGANACTDNDERCTSNSECCSGYCAGIGGINECADASLKG